ncbi:Ras protein family member 12 [Fasciola hepatica]|uniref:small monomeric GTPase n=1 Tax=Fasciola hepatica TaxID=6192 RepID=A0A4E0RX45_FASHE|nr:Ras protein family member 12 [Fasciola hepatica]
MDMDDILKWSQAIIVLFSITSRRSFYRAQELIETLRQTCAVSNRASTLSPQRQSVHSASMGGSSPATSPLSPMGPGHSSSMRRSAMFGGTPTIKPPTVILVANKSDLDRFRLVEKMEAEEFAKRHGIPYYETTATESYQEVQSIFHSVVRLSSGGRLVKSRGPNGSGSFSSRQLTPSNTSLSSSTGSVLSSLAVSPGLLLQKKAIPTGPTSGTSETNLSALGSESDQSGSGAVSKLANLRFRGASPPTFAKNLRSPSPSWAVARSPSESTAHMTNALLTTTTPQPSSVPPPVPPPPIIAASLASTNQSRSINPGSEQQSQSPLAQQQSARATTPSALSRVSLTSQILKAVQASSTEDSAASNRNLSGQSQSTVSGSTVVAHSQSSQPSKKSPMSFRFFSKKSK